MPVTCPLLSALSAWTVDGGESTKEEFVLDSQPNQTGTHNVTVDIGTDTSATTVELHPTPIPGSEGPPQDLDGNELYEDVDDDGNLTIFDVQALFSIV